MKFMKMSKPLKKLPVERIKAALAVAVMNDKGGCGKTSITDAFAHVLMRMGFRVLIIDQDPQCNITQRLGILDYDETNIVRVDAIYSSIINGDYINKVDSMPINIVYPENHMKESRYYDGELGVLGIIAGSPESEVFASTAKHVRPGGRAEAYLGEIIDHLKQYYDFIIFDTAPGIHDNAINEMTVAVADQIVIPFDGSEAVLGLSLFMRWLKYADKENRHSPLFVLSKYQADTVDISRALGYEKGEFEGVERSHVYRTMKYFLGDFVCDAGIQELRVLRSHTFIGMTKAQKKPYIDVSKELLSKMRKARPNSTRYWFETRIGDRLLTEMTKLEKSRKRNIETQFGKIQHLKGFDEGEL